MVKKLSATLVALSFVAIAQPAVGQTAADAKIPALAGKPGISVRPAVIGAPAAGAPADAAANAAAAKAKKKQL